MDSPAEFGRPDGEPTLTLTVEQERHSTADGGEPTPTKTYLEPRDAAYAAFRAVYSYPREGEWRDEPMPTNPCRR